MLGLSRPVLLAPMAAISGGRLAAAFSAAGGYGFLGGGYGVGTWIEDQWAEASRADIGVGLITWRLTDDVLDRVLALGPRAVWLGFGDPSPFAERIIAAGAVLVCQVGTEDEAKQALEAGASVLVAQGDEAGGHGRFALPVTELLDRILDLGSHTPVVAAGGIVDADDLRSALARGAAGVALGTAAYATVEALDADLHKNRIVDATGDASVVSIVYDHLRGPVWPDGFAGRSLRTELTDRWVDHEHDLASRADLQEWYRDVMPSTAPEQRVVWAGEAASRVTRILAARELVESFPTIELLARHGKAAP